MNSSYRGIIRILLLSSGLLVALQLFMIPRVNFNWDEFNELSHLFALESGFHIGVFRQGLHYLFWPLKYLNYGETTLLVIARYFNYGFAVIPILGFIYAIGTKVYSRFLGWVSIFCCLSFSIFLEASIQYRTDPFSTLLFLWGLYHFLKAPEGKRVWLLPGLLLGLSMFLNPKAIFQLFILSGCFGYYFLYGPKRGSWFLKLFLFNLMAAVTFIALIGFHVWVYDLSWQAVSQHFQSTADVGFGNTIGWDYKFAFLKKIFLSNPLGSLLFMLGLFLAIRHAWRNRTQIDQATLLLLVALAHLATIVVHQGVHKYYAVNLIPLFAWLVALPFCEVVQNYFGNKELSASNKRILVYLTLVFCALFAIGIGLRLPFLLTQTSQHQHLQNKVFNQLFPSATAYGDGFGLLARKNNTIQLLTGRRLYLYQKRGTSMLKPLRGKDFPAFLIFSQRMPLRALLRSDRQFLQQEYIAFFGDRLWVHGKRFEAQSLLQPQTFSLLLEGEYALSGNLEGLLIDGQPAQANMFLSLGSHEIVGRDDQGSIQISYGSGPPDMALPRLELPATTEGNLRIPQSARWYVPPADQLHAIRASINQLTLAQNQPYEKQLSIFLDEGTYPFSNPSGRKIHLHTLGPLFYREAHE